MSGSDIRTKSGIHRGNDRNCGVCGAPIPDDRLSCTSCGHRFVTTGQRKNLDQGPLAGEDETLMVVKSGGQTKRFRLVMVSDDATDTRSFDLSDGSVIGRTGGDIQLANRHVSRRHCEFLLRSGNLYLVDLNSTNGVFVKVRNSAHIDPPTELLLGNTLLRIIKSGK